jgi:hypothetical protein
MAYSSEVSCLFKSAMTLSLQVLKFLLEQPGQLPATWPPAVQLATGPVAEGDRGHGSLALAVLFFGDVWSPIALDGRSAA